MMRLFPLVFFLLMGAAVSAQEFTLADTLRGTLSPLRSCFNVHFYELDIAIDPELRTISGSNTIHFTAEADIERLQIDLFANLTIDSIVHQDRRLEHSRLHNAVFIAFPNHIGKGNQGVVKVYYHGTPTEAKAPPWDGGFIWKKDANGQHHIGVACEGYGASSWWPNKDHLSDEPDSMRMHFTAPTGLVCVSNGRFLGSRPVGNGIRWSWSVSNPINNYNVTLNMGDYAHFREWYRSGNDSLQLNYYVLKDNLTKAKEHFKQVPPMLAIFEEAFGPYPFHEDGYALVETTYAGMEHQSCIAYGNKYMKGYWGRHPSDMDFDYIIIHETGHEWWGNSVTANDLADMWVHESFCTYSESVFVEAKYGYVKMVEYLLYQKNFITNDSPVRGPFGVNQEGNSGDMYYKGSWMLHTLRSVVNEDVKFKAMLKAIATEFRHRNVDGTEIIQFISSYLGKNMTPFFEQYIGYADLPVLEYRLLGRKLSMRWKSDVPGFAMPMEILGSDGNFIRADVTQNEWVAVNVSKSFEKEVGFREDRFLFTAKKL